MILRDRSVIIHSLIIILLASSLLKPTSAMGTEENKKPNSLAEIEKEPVAESREFNTATILGDPLQESVGKRRVVRWVGLLGPPAGVALYGFLSDREIREFRYVDDGWFTRDDRYEGGADKVGHAFTSYVLTRFLTNWVFDYSESTHSRALTYGVISSSLSAVAVEIVDGYFYDGFSWRDLVANAAGIGFAALLEVSPTLDRLLGFSATYWPSDDLEGNRFETDYNGWRFFLNIKLTGIPKIQDTFLRYAQIDVGFYTCKRFKPAYTSTTGSPDRHFTLGFSINLSQVFRDIFKTNKAISRSARIFEYYHVPLGVTVVDKTVKEGKPGPAARK